MKYDLIQIIKDKLKILEKNKMAALVLKEMLNGSPTNIGKFEANSFILLKLKKKQFALNYFLIIELILAKTFM